MRQKIYEQLLVNLHVYIRISIRKPNDFKAQELAPRLLCIELERLINLGEGKMRKLITKTLLVMLSVFLGSASYAGFCQPGMDCVGAVAPRTDGATHTIYGGTMEAMGLLESSQNAYNQAMSDALNNSESSGDWFEDLVQHTEDINCNGLSSCSSLLSEVSQGVNENESDNLADSLDSVSGFIISADLSVEWDGDLNGSITMSTGDQIIFHNGNETTIIIGN